MKRALWALAVLVPLVAVVAWIGWYSPWFALDSVQVRISSAPEAAGPLATQEVEALVEVPDGTPLLRISPSEVEARIAALPQVASVTVSRSWPTTLVIDVERRVPVAAVPTQAGGYDIVDATGVVIRQSPTAVADVPTVRAAGPGLEAAIAVVRDMPEWLRDKVEGIEATTRNDVTLQLRNGSVVIWGAGEENEFKAEVLRVLLKVKALRYDVSAPGTPATSNSLQDPAALPSATASPAP
ncbi:MAG: cell division protein FtsQ/DivIB [Actinomycetota bacterium]